MITIDELRARCRRAFDQVCVPYLREEVAKNGPAARRAAELLALRERAEAAGMWGEERVSTMRHDGAEE